MAKRVAEEYLTNVGDPTPNDTDGRESDPVKMATPAQLAARKLKTPKSRLGTRTNGQAGSGFSSINAQNPFAQQQQQQATFAPVGGSSAFSFGQQSQSFPPASAPSSGGFSFTAPQSGSFTFGQDASQPATSSAPSFSFGSNNAAQTAPTTFSFGQPAQTNGQGTASANVFGSFGQTTQQSNGQSTPAPSLFNFGQNESLPNGESTPAAPLFSFGQNTSQPATSLFSAPQSASLFGQNNNNSATTTPPSQPTFSFGQSTQPNGQSTPASTGFGFGQKTSQPEAPSAFGAPKPTFSFGSNSDSTKEQSQPLFSFGKTVENKEQSSTAQPAKNFIFGESTSQPSSSSLFGQSTSGPAPTSLFGAQKPSFIFGSSAVAEEPSVDDAMMISPPRKSLAPSEPQISSPAGETAPSSTVHDSEPATESAPIGNSLFGQTKAPLFNFGAPSSTATPATSQNSLFGRMTEAPSFSFGAPTASTGLTSPFKPQSAATELSAPSPVTETAQPPKSPFQNLTPAPEKPKSFFQSPGRTPAVSTSPPLVESTPAPKSLFQAPPPASTSEPSFKSLFGTQAPTQQHSTPFAAPEATQESIPAVETPPVTFEKVKLRSNGPSEPLVTDDHAKWTEHDKKYRLRSLNKELVRRLAHYHPASQDFDNVLIFYFQTREKLGLIWPPTTSKTKRKADDGDRSDDRSPPAKKSKADESSSGNANATSNIFSKAPNSTFTTPITDHDNNAPAPSTSFKGPSSGTSNLFQSMLSASSVHGQSDKPSSSFTSIFSKPVQSDAMPIKSTPLTAATKYGAPAKPISPPSEEADDADDDEQESEQEIDEDAVEGEEEMEDESQEGRDESQEGREESEDENGSDDDHESDTAPLAQPENQGKSLFDRIQAPRAASSENAVTTPNGVQEKTNLKQPAPNHSFKPFTPFGPGVTKSTPQPPTVSPLTPFGGSVKAKPIAPFEFKPKAPTGTPTPAPGASIFAGGSVNSNGPLPGEGLFGSRPSTPSNGDAAPTNIFAGFAKMASTAIDPTKDNTWSKGSPLKFGDSPKSTAEVPKFGSGNARNWMQAFGQNAEDQQAKAEKKAKEDEKYNDLGSDADEDEIEEWEKAYEEKQRAKRVNSSQLGQSKFGQGGFKPSVAQVDGQADTQSTTAPSFNITAATPPKSSTTSERFTSLFGQKSLGASPAPSASNTVGFSFGAAPSSEPSSAPAAASALQPAASYLFASANNSGISSRATSPGLTDNESVNTDGDADPTNDPQTSLMSDRPGEENEEVLYETRTKALKYLDKDAAAKQKGSTPNAYNSVGLGILRVLKNAETGKARIVIRAEPGANVLLNTHLMPFISYVNDSRAAGSGVVRFGVPKENDKIEQWVLKVKDSKKAVELAEVLTNNKSST